MKLWEQSVKSQLALQDAAVPHESHFELEIRNITEYVWNKPKMHNAENKERFSVKENDEDTRAGLVKSVWFCLAWNCRF